MKKKTLFVLLTSLFLLSCVSLFTPRATFQESYQAQVTESRKTWLGQDVQDIYTHPYWGAPDKKTYDNNGGYLLTYVRRRTVPNIFSDSGGSLTLTDITTFYINSSGKVYDMKARRE